MDRESNNDTVIATLHFGRYWSVGFTALMCGIAVFMAALSVFAVIGSIIFMQFSYLVSLVVLVPACVITVRIIITGVKNKKTVDGWKNSSVRLKAMSQTLGIRSGEYMISVSFVYDGTRIKAKSGEKSDADTKAAFTGYHKIYGKYRDREIDILYCPEHDEVMILKQNILP